MIFRRFTSLASFLLLAVAISGVNTPANGVSAPPEARVRFSQVMAVSDFDADGLIDEARIAGSSVHRSVDILLSATGKRLFLHFRQPRAIHGSIFARDVDNDGATDLIWADPFQLGEVIVWLGDGSGNFERVDSTNYRNEFALGDPEITKPEGSREEIALTSETTRHFFQIVNAPGLDQIKTELPDNDLHRSPKSSPDIGQPAGRGPPTLLS